VNHGPLLRIAWIPAMMPMPTTMMLIAMPHSRRVRGWAKSGLVYGTGRVWSAPHIGHTWAPCSRMTKHDQHEGISLRQIPAGNRHVNACGSGKATGSSRKSLCDRNNYRC